MVRIVMFIYSVVAGAVFFATFLFALGMAGNIFETVGIPERQLVAALYVNMFLLSGFVLQRCLFSRPNFLRRGVQSDYS